MLLKIIHSRKALKSFGKRANNFIVLIFNYKYKGIHLM